MYSPTLDPKSWIVPKGYDDFIVSEHRVPQRELGPSDRLKLILVCLFAKVHLKNALLFPAYASSNDSSGNRLRRRIYD